MFFKKSRKKEFKKIKKTINHTVIRNQYRVDSHVLKNLTEERKGYKNEVIVSLTTYSKRIWDVHLVLESVAQQTVLPDKVILWLAEDEFTINDLPLSIISRMNHGLEVKFCKDLKSYKKIIPALREFTDSLIVTLDDDIIYPPDTLELLLKEHQKHPKYIIGNRAHEVTYRNGSIMPYKRWRKEIQESTGNVFLTGCGGVLYPPGSLYSDVINSELFMEICPHADDVWLHFMAKLNGTEIRKANGRDFDEFVEVSVNDSPGLNKLNVDKGYNDKQIKRVVNYYHL